jgi:DNA-binding ferritin-like protein (Dps family)
MSEIKRIKQENKALRKQLKDENLMLYRDIESYIFDYKMKKEERILIKNQILNDFISRLKDNKSVWDSIGNPQDYCDKYLIDVEKKDTSFLGLFRRLLPSYLFIFFAFFLLENYFSLSQQMRLDPSMIEISSASVIKNLCYPMLGLIQVFDIQRKMFVRNRSLRLSSYSFLFLWVFITILLTGVTYDVFVFDIPKIYIYIGAFISSLIAFIEYRSDN